MASRIPIVADVDVLVIGGTAAGVSLALAAKRGGASVMLIGPRAYLGEDIASRYAFWDRVKFGERLPGKGSDAGRELIKAVFPSTTEPPTPMQVKLTLEQSLVAADVPFLLLSSPAGVLRDEEGHTRGALIANRGGRQAILAGRVVDASIEGTFSSLAGHAMAARLTGKQQVTHVTLCHGEGSDAEGLSCERLPGYQGTVGNFEYDLSARRYTLEVDLGDGSPEALARAEAEAVERCWVPEQYLHQEQLALEDETSCGCHSEGGNRDGKSTVACALGGSTIEAYEQADGAIALTPAAAIDNTLRGALLRPLKAILMGDIIGHALVERTAPASVDPKRLTITCEGGEPVPSGELRTLVEPLRPGRRATRVIESDSDALPRVGAFDVVVIGGGTGGAPAAISAGMAGARTAVLEQGPALGGVGTLGQIAKYYYGNRVGFTEIIDAGVKEMEYRENFKKAQGGWSQAAKCAYLHRQCHQNDVAMFFRTTCVGVWVDESEKGTQVRGVVVAGPFGYGLIECKVVVDSTGCSDIPAAAGAATTVIGADHVAVQGVGLAGYAPGRDYHNSDHNFSDDTDPADVTAFLVSSKVKFADHFDAGQLVDSRERRQIIGEATLDPVDFLYERRFPDTVCVSSSNFDTHGFTVHPVFMVKPPDKERLWVDVPYRCLLPQGLEGVLVTGLGVSAHRDAIPVIRMQPDVQNQGYAAGHAAAMAARAKARVRDIDIRALQQHLIEMNCLPERVLTDSNSFPVDDALLDKAIAEQWDDYVGLALIFSDPARSIPRLHEALSKATDEAQRTRYALVLALMNDATGRDVLDAAVRGSEWDAGWNYRGMGQFGMSLSPVDALVVGLGTIGDASSWPTLVAKAEALSGQSREAGELPDFSHCRALALAFERLAAGHPSDAAIDALTNVLQLPGVMGHAQATLAEVHAALTEDINENTVRNNALRELVLARGLLNAGDPEGLAFEILRRYADDLRGHFARHARANLDRKRPGWEDAPERDEALAGAK